MDIHVSSPRDGLISLLVISSNTSMSLAEGSAGRSESGALAKSNINILAVTQTSRQTNMQFVVERDSFTDAQVALHRSLCE